MKNARAGRYISFFSRSTLFFKTLLESTEALGVLFRFPFLKDFTTLTFDGFFDFFCLGVGFNAEFC